MPACPSCGRENADDARFCSACGSPLGPVEQEREQRKVVTVLFCDLVGSTALGESTDPEALRARLFRTFETLRAIIERHGGTVEKFVGDAVMAVFGIPVSHEDDALRAVRAATEMREAIAGHGLEARIGVNTGEVVVGGEGETLVTGDAVNVAARLEQATPPGSILIGAQTRLLVRDAVRVEAVEPLALKGKSEPVEAYRLIEVSGDIGLARHLDTPLVGRERERQRIWRAYEDAMADRSCQLFTLLGPAGIGKSRLVADFLERAGGSADVLRGRCLSYGEGITYWPLVEMLIAIDVEPDSVIGTSPPETQLAFRRLLEARAAERPQVVVIDDLQWAEPVFVDLVEHIADLSRGAPIFVLCVARTELLDVRPGWGGGKMNATSLLLEPLDDEECGELMDLLIEHTSLDEELRERITQASAGNPLYVEEMLAMVREHGEGEVAVPPTIHALLQARIDALEGDVRAVMERGAVEGEVFHRNAVSVLAPDEIRPGVEGHLATLVRKELIRSTAPTFPQDEGFRFRHLLIRDAAYESLPKATRAELHEQFADWLSTHELVEGDEIVGYHLEQSHRYRAELDPADPMLDGLARRASEHLAAAGRGALDRGDVNAAISLLQRAADLLPEDDDDRLALAPDLTDALAETGDEAAIAAVLLPARRSTDVVLRAKVAILETAPEYSLSGAITSAERSEKRDRARVILESERDDDGLSLYWWTVGREAWFRCRAEETATAFELALDHAERAGSTRRAHHAASWMAGTYSFGPRPAREAIARIEDVRARFAGSVLLESHTRVFLGMLAAMQGEHDRGRQLVRSGIETYRDAGMAVSAAGMSMGEAWVEVWAGQHATAEEVLRASLDVLPQDERGFRPTIALQLADLLYEEDRLGEAEELCAEGRSLTTPDDLINFLYLDLIEGGICAQRGQPDEAEQRVRQAVALAETTDFYWAHGASRVRLAEVYARAGRRGEAPREAAAGLAHFAAKGDAMSEARARERLATLGIEVV